MKQTKSKYHLFSIPRRVLVNMSGTFIGCLTACQMLNNKNILNNVEINNDIRINIFNKCCVIN